MTLKNNLYLCKDLYKNRCRLVINMKYILVTGGSRGIGRVVCLRLVSFHMPILINYHSNTSAAEETNSLIEAMGGTEALIPFNVSDKAAYITGEVIHVNGGLYT